ncbi:MAG: maleylpyruvate isomerase family mycothiol-dependent enzyme [Actinomycetota bacterium]|nr:maleylpyruvate isomerase family mycothiol-dependent enzyme [Actinomycetota bacterium]
MPEISAIVADLADEQAELDSIVRDLAADAWDAATPAEGWSIRDQISHLAFFDEQARLAVEDADAFGTGLRAAAADVEAFMNGPLDKGRNMAVGDVLAWWRAARDAEVSAFRVMDVAARIPWFGPAMSPASFVSARIMETWAHGQDVIDALGIVRIPTDRLKHICHLGVRARPNSYAARGRAVPPGEIAVHWKAPMDASGRGTKMQRNSCPATRSISVLS